MNHIEFNIVSTLADLLLPPGGNILLLFAGLTLIPTKRFAGAVLTLFALVLLYLCSIPLVSNGLMLMNEPYPALDEKTLKLQGAQAIVVLGGGRERNAAEYGGVDTVNRLTLQRIRYAAWLYHRTNLPVIVSGGSPGSSQGRPRSEADLMREVLEKEFDTKVEAVEEQSPTTYFNAKYTADILKMKGYKHVFLVTHAWHMPRAVEAFQHFGIDAIPAPTAFDARGKGYFDLSDIVPAAYAMQDCYWALHEIVGRWWYQTRYYDNDKPEEENAQTQ